MFLDLFHFVRSTIRDKVHITTDKTPYHYCGLQAVKKEVEQTICEKIPLHKQVLCSKNHFWQTIGLDIL